jgi:hypothetical protein
MAQWTRMRNNQQKLTKTSVPGVEAGLLAAARVVPNGVQCEQTL